MGTGPHTTDRGIQRREKALHHVTTVDVPQLSHGLSESYSPWTQCSSCFGVCLLSVGHGVEKGLELRKLHLDTHRAFLLITTVLIMFLSHAAQFFTTLNLWLTWNVLFQLDDVNIFIYSQPMYWTYNITTTDTHNIYPTAVVSNYLQNILLLYL